MKNGQSYYQLNDVDDDLKSFLQYVDGKITEDPFVQEIHQQVCEIKQNEKWREEYMYMSDKIRLIQQEAIEEGREIGLTQGLQKGQKKIIANMLKQQLDYGQISTLTGLSEQEVQEMAEELKEKNA